jgi:hypothetical protein
MERFRQDRGLHKATMRVEFFPQDQVAPHIFWHRTQDQESDTVALVVFVYARILYELAELNETRVARQVIEYLEKRFCQPLVADKGARKRPKLSLGKLRLVNDIAVPPARTYQVDFYELRDGGSRLDFKGSLGEEKFYLPATFMVILQYCLNTLGEEPLMNLARGLSRLHTYYRFRRDFWDGSTLTSGPAFALGTEEIKAEEAAPEV